MSNVSRPFKVWNKNRNIKKSVAASTIEELFLKAKQKLNIPSGCEVRLVLEEDGTEIDDDDYLAFLPDHATLQVIDCTECWEDRNAAEKSIDQPDSAFVDPTNERLTFLVNSLRKDLSSIAMFTTDDLQLLVDMDETKLAAGLHSDLAYAHSVHEAFLTHLDSCDRSNEAMDLLRLYHKSQTARESGDPGAGAKRRKIP